MSSPAAWHPDPTRRHDHRWWDGTKWTEHAADAGESTIDHLSPGEAPPPPAGDLPPASPSDPDVTASGSTAVDANETDPGTGGLAGDGAWEGTADPRQGPAWQQPGTDPSATAQQPAWQQGPADGGAYAQGGQYGQPAWDQGPGYGQAPATGTDGVAIAALVLGILALLSSWFVLGGLLGIVSLVLGFIGLGRVKRNRSKGRGMAITGIVTGIVSIIVAILIVVIGVTMFGDLFGEAIPAYERCLEENTREFCDQQLQDDLMEQFGQN